MVYKYNNKVIYGIDENGVHHTTDARFYEYLLARTETPHKVIIHTTLHEMLEALKEEAKA